MRVQPGTWLGPYEILSLLGAGGMGEVYRARDPRLDRDVAIKILAPGMLADHAALDRFTREARAASALNHPNIVTIHDTGDAAAGRFIVMEFVSGRTLRALIVDRPALKMVGRLGEQLARALAAAHAAGIVHRDLKPENVMVREDELVKVLDFGVARLVPEQAAAVLALTATGTGAGALVGTARYMSPEQARGEPATSASDIFALGLVLCELATSRHPFGDGPPLQVLQAIAPQPARLPGDHPGFERLIERMLDRDPSRRPPAIEVEGALEEIARARPMAVRTPAAQPRLLVGRTREREDLRAAFDRAATGRGLLVGVAGEPGIGKTTLVEEFLDELRAGGTPVRVALSRCSERLAGTEAYFPILEALETLVRGDPTGAVSSLLRRVAPAWADQVLPQAPSEPAAGAALRAQAASEDRLKRELGSFVEEVCRTEPLVLVVEDLHWAGASTVEMLAYLGTRVGTLSLLLVVMYRSEELERTRHPFLPVKLELQARGACREIALHFLIERDLARYLELLFPGHDFPPALAELLYAKTEGSPLFMVDLVRALHDRGAIVRREAAWRLTEAIQEIAREVPESVRGMIERKIGLLSDADRRLLLTASIQGDRFDTATVAAALALDAAEVEERIEVVERRLALVRRLGERELPDGTLTLHCGFVHALYQNALYRMLTPARRASSSRAVAEALERHYAGRLTEVAAELAVLFETARAHARAAEYFCLAAAHAGRMSAHREAVSLGQSGLRLLAAGRDDRTRRQELNLLAAMSPSLVAIRGYGAPEVLEAYSRARELSEELEDVGQRFAALRGLWEYQWLRTNVPAAVTLARELYEVAERSGDTALRVVAHDVMGDTSLSLGDFPAARAYTDGGISLYDPARHGSLAADYVGYDPGMACHSMSAHALWYLGFPDQAIRRSEEGVALARRSAHPSTLAFALGHAGLHHYLRREPRATLALAEEVLTLSAEHGLAFWAAFAAILRGWSLVELERDPAGIALMQEGIRGYRDTGGDIERPYWLAMLAEAHRTAGGIEEGLAILERGLEEIQASGIRFFEAELHRLTGELALARDPAHAVVAERSFRDALEIAGRQQGRSLELRAAVGLTRLLARRGEGEEGRRRLAEVLGWFTEGLTTPDLQEARAILEQRT